MKNSKDKLQKSPTVSDKLTPEHIAAAYGHSFDDQAQHHLIASNKTKRFYHHAFESTDPSGGEYFSHVLSTSPNPFDTDAHVAMAEANPSPLYSPYGAEPVQIYKANSKFVGQGHGQELREAILHHHGHILSDYQLSPAEDKLWTDKLKHTPGIATKTGIRPHEEHEAWVEDPGLFSQHHGIIPLFANNSKLEKSTQLTKGSAQRKLPFNPTAVPTEDKETLHAWTTYGYGDYTPEEYMDAPQRARDDLPVMDAAAHTRAISRLVAKTPVRKNPKTGEHEVLLHRGVSKDELRSGKKAGHFSTRDKSSWTTDHDVASKFSDPTWSGFNEHEYDDNDTPELLHGGPGDVISAWIPLKHIHNIPNQYGNTQSSLRAKGPSDYHKEREVVVHPGQFKIHTPRLTPPVSRYGEFQKRLDTLKKPKKSKILSKSERLQEMDPTKTKSATETERKDSKLAKGLIYNKKATGTPKAKTEPPKEEVKAPVVTPPTPPPVVKPTPKEPPTLNYAKMNAPAKPQQSPDVGEYWKAPHIKHSDAVKQDKNKQKMIERHSKNPNIELIVGRNKQIHAIKKKPEDADKSSTNPSDLKKADQEEQTNKQIADVKQKYAEPKKPSFKEKYQAVKDRYGKMKNYNLDGQEMLDKPNKPGKLKKDDKPHPAGSPDDSAHDAAEGESSLKQELAQQSTPKKRQELMDHLKTLKDSGKLRSKKNQSIGND